MSQLASATPVRQIRFQQTIADICNVGSLNQDELVIHYELNSVFIVLETGNSTLKCCLSLPTYSSHVRRKSTNYIQVGYGPLKYIYPLLLGMRTVSTHGTILVTYLLYRALWHVAFTFSSYGRFFKLL